MAQYFNSDSSPFYRNKFPRPPVLDKGNLGPPIFGPYQQRWDPTKRIWVRPDGSRAPLSGLGELVLPDMDMSTAGPQLVDKQTFVVLAGALALGLGGGWALQHHHKMAGYALLGVGSIAAVLGVIRLKQNSDGIAAQEQWAAAQRELRNRPPLTGGILAPKLSGVRR